MSILPKVSFENFRNVSFNMLLLGYPFKTSNVLIQFNFCIYINTYQLFIYFNTDAFEKLNEVLVTSSSLGPMRIVNKKAD